MTLREERNELHRYLMEKLRTEGLSLDELNEIGSQFMNPLMTVQDYIDARWENGELVKNFEGTKFFQRGSDNS